MTLRGALPRRVYCLLPDNRAGLARRAVQGLLRQGSGNALSHLYYL